MSRSTDPVTGVIYNPRSHRNRGRDLDVGERTNVLVEHPRGIPAITAALERLADRGIEFLVINGGDGTVRDVLTAAQGVFGDDWPELAVLPKGKTNALNVDLGAPADWTLRQAIEAFADGKRIVRPPIAIAPIDDADNIGTSVLGFIMGGGAFTLGVRAGQDAHRMGAFNSLAVAVTTGWGVVSIVGGGNGNKWRRGTPMQFRLGRDGTELPHCGTDDDIRRNLFLASTLERFPAGMKLFGPDHTGLKLMVLDRPRRRIFASVPVLLAGRVPQWAKRRGFHQIAADQFELTIGDEYILDGEAYPAGRYRVSTGPELSFVVP